MPAFADFCPHKPRLICFDSDGSVMDTMNTKHQNCFGPCLVEAWGLQAQAAQVLALGEQYGRQNGRCRKDYGGNDRVVVLQKPEKNGEKSLKSDC